MSPSLYLINDACGNYAKDRPTAVGCITNY